RLIRAAHIVACQDGRHVHLKDGCLVTEGDSILHVGPSYDGPADETIAWPGVVTPGLINTHAHIAGSPLDKSFVEDRGPRQFYLSGLFEFLPARERAMSPEGPPACIDFSVPELLTTGTTTIMEIGIHGERTIEACVRHGLRAYVGQGFRSGRWYTDDGKTVKYQWFEDEGREAFERSVAFCETHERTHGDLIRTFITPMQIDTVTEAMLKRSRAAAEDLGVPYALHAAQSVNEFQEMARRTGITPIEWLRDIGFLGPGLIMGHAIIPGEGTWANFAGSDDIGILADTGTNVAHAVWVFCRRGIAMESYARYRARGVNMTIATDTCPQSMVEAMRWTAVVSKMVDRRTEVATAADVFESATLGGAKALGRDDLGRIAPGAKADLILWKGASLTMTPLRDPLKNIVFNAAHTDIDTVIVNGRVVVEGGKVPGLDEAAVARRLQDAAEAMWAGMGSGDWAGRDVDTLSPQSLPPFR
ncbi:MAG: amidohydrolase family protein, partial [Pseudomonadota bacterium]